MTTHDVSTDQPQATGYFKAKIDGHELFNADRLLVTYGAGRVYIHAAHKEGYDDAVIFLVTINANTPNGDYEFESGGNTNLERVEWHTEKGMTSASTGTYKVNFDHPSKRYQMSFKLKFAYTLEIEAEFDITA